MFAWLNDKLTGFRTFLLSLLPVALLLFEQSVQVLGPMLIGGQMVTKAHIIGAVLVSAPVAIKMFMTDVLPKFQGKVIIK